MQETIVRRVSNKRMLIAFDPENKREKDERGERRRRKTKGGDEAAAARELPRALLPGYKDLLNSREERPASVAFLIHVDFLRGSRRPVVSTNVGRDVYI